MGLPHYFKFNGTRWSIHEFGVYWKRLWVVRRVHFDQVTEVAYDNVQIYLNGIVAS